MIQSNEPVVGPDYKAECARLEEEMKYIRDEERRIREEEGMRYEMRLKEMERNMKAQEESFKKEIKFKDEIIKSILHIREV